MKNLVTTAFVLFTMVQGNSWLHAQTLESRLLSEPLASLADAARESGDARRGAIIFHQPHMACSKCHDLAGRENGLGPDLTRLPDDASNVHLVESVLRPSKVIRRGYEPRTLLLTDGRVVTGLPLNLNVGRIADPSDSDVRTKADGLAVRPADDGTVTLRDPTTGGLLKFTADEIEQQVISRQSIMPPQQVNQLASRQQFLDLIAYLIAIRDGGPERARELQPPAALFAVKLPEYESRVDHAGILRDLDQQAFDRGEAIYQRLCINCHGDHEKPGSLPTALRFAEGKFKNGSDPFTMYQTLTRGFGFMIPQPWMVPQQKYDVIHYVREAYLKEHNAAQYTTVSETYLEGLPKGDTRGPKPRKYEPWSDMDYGPHLVGTYEIPGNPAARSSRGAAPLPNLAYKGIATRLDAGAGGVAHGDAWTVFDHDTLRVAGAWASADQSRLRFIDWQGIHFNGRHGTHPTVVGDVHLFNPIGPGWANPRTGSFEDDQRILGRDSRRYGPLPREWAQFHGFYVHEEKTIFSYSVGENDILEMPGMVGVGRIANPSLPRPQDQTDELAIPPAYTRAFNVGPRPRRLTLLVATHPRRSAKLATRNEIASLAADESRQVKQTATIFNGSQHLQIDDAAAFNMEEHSFTITARLRTTRGGTIFAKTAPVEEWVPGGKALFVRNGRLCYDTGWVGVVQSNRRIDDGQWHDVVITRNGDNRLVRLYVDGAIVGKGKLNPGEPLKSPVLRVGYCAPDFPKPVSTFIGELQDIRFLMRELSPKDIERQAAAQSPAAAHWPLSASEDALGVDKSGNRRDLTVQANSGVRSEDLTIVAGLSTHIDGAQWRSDKGRLLLDVPAGDEPLSFVLWTTSTLDLGEESSLNVGDVPTHDPQPDLSRYTRGGRPRWPDQVHSQMTTIDAGGPFAVDELLRPTNNPWLARTRLTGLDFFDDPDRMVVTSWDGDVWLVTGLAPAQGDADTRPSNLTWQRIASGLFQPLGVKVVKGEIYVSCRDQLVVLRDLNGDGETDFYECFNNDHQVTEHFHEFAMGLQVDEAGNFYYAKSARHALPAVVPHHGTLLRVTPDGTRTDILANGFRAANGVCLNPDGTFIVTDQEGHWNPKNRINWVTPGIGSDVRFYGNMFGYHDVTNESDEAMEPPLCWITNDFDRSPSELLWVGSDRWGPLGGSLLNLSYGYGKAYIVPHEEVDGLKQGGMCALPIAQLPTGTMRGRFSPHDGYLYLCGMFAWGSSQQSQEGGLYRIRMTGKPAYLPIGLQARWKGLILTFSDPLDREAATAPENYAVKVWSLERTANYGSEHFNEHALRVAACELSPDGRTVTLQIPQIAPTWCMEIRCTLAGADGEPFERVIHNTIHRLGNPIDDKSD